MNRRAWLLGLGLAGAAAVAIFGDRTPSGSPAVEVAPRRSSAPPAQERRKHSEAAILALVPRATLIGHDFPDRPPSLFGSRTLVETPAAATPSEVPRGEPEVPQLPFTYLGKKYQDGKWEVYLAIGDQTYFVREGSVVDQTYAVNTIRPPILTLTYLPKKQMQTMTIGDE